MNKIYKIKTLAPTNYKGTRIKITNLNNKNNITIPYNYKYNNSLDMARNYIENNIIYLKPDFHFYDKDILYIVYKTKV